MLRSLRGRLIVLLLLLVVAAIAAGALMVGLFRQSATARAVKPMRKSARLRRDQQGLSLLWHRLARPAAGRDQDRLRQDLTTVVQTALRHRSGVEGGVWQRGMGSLAYAFPTYQGAEPKTDIPQAELPRIEAINRQALAEDRQAGGRYDAGSQILLITACPLPGLLPEVTGWTMTRVFTFAGRSYRQLMAGLGVLFASVVLLRLC